MPRDFAVTIHDPARKADFERVLGTTTVYVLSPNPERADLPDQPGALVYFMDLDQLSVQQIRAMVEHLAERFGLSAMEVEANIGEHGVPILAAHCTVTVRHPQRWVD